MNLNLQHHVIDIQTIFPLELVELTMSHPIITYKRALLLCSLRTEILRCTMGRLLQRSTVWTLTVNTGALPTESSVVDISAPEQ